MAKVTQTIGVHKHGHVMLDLETMGKKSNAAIVSIGAVEFNIETAETGDQFYGRVDLQSCLDYGLTVDASTVYWWLLQSEQARKEIAHGGDNLAHALNVFSEWFRGLGQDVQIWGNGATFDLGILSSAYEACVLPEPWSCRNERDVRTMVSLYPEVRIKHDKNFKGVEHNPIDDCKHQINYLSEIWNRI